VVEEEQQAPTQGEESEEDREDEAYLNDLDFETDSDSSEN
jgi:hypothetical protein